MAARRVLALGLQLQGDCTGSLAVGCCLQVSLARTGSACAPFALATAACSELRLDTCDALSGACGAAAKVGRGFGGGAIARVHCAHSLAVLSCGRLLSCATHSSFGSGGARQACIGAMFSMHCPPALRSRAVLHVQRPRPAGVKRRRQTKASRRGDNVDLGVALMVWRQAGPTRVFLALWREKPGGRKRPGPQPCCEPAKHTEHGHLRC